MEIAEKKEKKCTKFKKGVSGNPAGKPKGTVHFKTILKKLLASEVDNNFMNSPFVLENKINGATLLMIALFNKALAGDVPAIKEIMMRSEDLLPEDNKVIFEEIRRVIVDSEKKELVNVN